ncbi:MAG: hypothetical protein R3F14_38000 [Polyangiaceae bacterium]
MCPGQSLDRGRTPRLLLAAAAPQKAGGYHKAAVQEENDLAYPPTDCNPSDPDLAGAQDVSDGAAGYAACEGALIVGAAGK